MALKQASVLQVKQQIFDRDKSYIAITMRFYPRFLRKELRDEFACDLAPEKQLLKEFNEAQKKLENHNAAFDACSYEKRFELTEKAWGKLQRLAQLAKTKDVYLVCVCRVGEMCHREMLMVVANKLYGCPIGEVFNKYGIVIDRLLEAGEASLAPTA